MGPSQEPVLVVQSVVDGAPDVSSFGYAVRTPAMDSLLERRLAAHARSATVHDRNAEFYRALASAFESLGEQAQATTARELAEMHGQSALREWRYATAKTPA